MRPISQEIQTVRTAVEMIVGKRSERRVFGSRLDDPKRGGDLDLLIESNAPFQAKFLWSIAQMSNDPTDWWLLMRVFFIG